MLAQTVQAWQEQLHRPVRVLTVEGATWGGGCNQAADLVIGEVDYLVFAGDDCPPRPGALKAAVDHWLLTGTVPGCRFRENGSWLNPPYDGLAPGTETAWTRLFLLTPDVYREVGPLLDISWYADLEYGQRLSSKGYRITICDGFDFDHLHGERTWLSPEVNDAQRDAYHQACAANGWSPLA
ncbi:MAG: hypothetical protein KGJ90_07255 [Patescibacteria group bacterium]|nr:hypothetical protein [Patescibacteria group bacterium]